MLLISKSKSELALLTEDELLNYFKSHAAYRPSGSPTHRYAIQPASGGRALYSEDTRDLFEKFKKSVHGKKKRACVTRKKR